LGRAGREDTHYALGVSVLRRKFEPADCLPFVDVELTNALRRKSFR